MKKPIKRYQVDLLKLQNALKNNGIESLSALSGMIGRSSTFLSQQIKEGGFTKNTIVSIEGASRIQYSEYKFEKMTNSSLSDLPKNEVVAYAREITRLSYICRNIEDLIAWYDRRLQVQNEMLVRILEELGIDTNQFNNEVFEYPEMRQDEQDENSDEEQKKIS